ncbi:MAG: sensor histidine kinase [Clostridium sp.]|uniref:sensor histidine kinase n=1 Tax=Clostridium sp. TaxID=1506 RepID=UPI003EE77E6E
MIDIVYIDKKNLGKLCFKLIIILLVIISFKSLGLDIEIIIEFYYLIISLIALLLIFSNKNEENRTIALDSAWIFFSISIFNLYAVVLKQENVLGELFNAKMEYFSIIKMLQILLGVKFIIDNLYGKRNIEKNIMYIIIFTILGFIMGIGESNYIVEAIILIGASIWTIFLIKKLKRVENENSIKTNKVNYIRFYLILSIIKNMTILISKYVFNKIIILELISGGITFVLCNTLFIYVVKEILNAPYNKVNGEINKSEKRVLELSSNLKHKNNEIDISRANIREIEQTFKKFFRSIPVPTIIINSIRGNIVYINKPGMELLGEKFISVLLGKNLMDLIELIEDKEIKKISSKIYFGEIKKTKKKIAIEYEDEKNDKGEEILLLTDLTFQIKGNNIENIIKEKKLSEEMKKKFLSNISHDLKTPINVIYSSVQVQDIYLKEENLKELESHKKICKQNALWLRRLTNNIIDIGKIELGFLGNGIMLRENIVEFIEDIFGGLVQYAKEEEIEMVFDTEEEEVFVEFNRDYMERIMLNIISNAIKYNRKKGGIKLYIEATRECVYIYLKDTGIGMNNELTERIFDRYSKGAKDKRGLDKSSGIGMYVVKKLVEAQNGKIEVKSKYGVGTEVVLKFSRVG